MEITNITVSTSRKINHKIYGASDYESSDNFCSLGAEVEVGENLVEKHRELMLMVKKLNNTAVSHDILKIQSGYAWDDFMEMVRQYRLGHLVITDDLTEKMNELQKNIFEEMKKLKRDNNK